MGALRSGQIQSGTLQTFLKIRMKLFYNYNSIGRIYLETMGTP